MAIQINDNFHVNAGKPIDSKYLNGVSTYANVAAVNAAVPISERYLGLTTLIGTDEYWYNAGLTNGDLVIKAAGGGSITGGVNGLSTSGPNVILGGTLTGNTTILSGGFDLTLNGLIIDSVGDINGFGNINEFGGSITATGAINIVSITNDATITGDTLSLNGTTAVAMAVGSSFFNMLSTDITFSGASTINVGTTGTPAIIIGNTTGATSITQRVGTGGYTLNGVASSVYNLGAATTTGTFSIGGTAQTGTASLFTGTGAMTINLGTGATGAKTISIGGTAVNVISIGNTQTGGSINTGSAMTTGTITIGGTGAHTGLINLFTGTGAQTINFATGNAIKTIHIGNHATPVNVIRIAGAASTLGFFGATPVVRQTMGAATATAVYTATEQAMLQAVYDAVRNLGLGT